MPSIRRRLPAAAPALLSLLLLSACGDRPPAARTPDGHPAVDVLPAPTGADGPVTGMPDTPGPGAIGAPDMDDMDEGDGDALAVDPATGAELPDTAVDAGDQALPPGAVEPGAPDAVALVRDYYRALEARDFDRAYALWADDGRASGQTPQQFVAGFAQTAHVAATVEPAGRIGAAAGTRYVEVPVAIESAQQDGTVRRFVGAYTLRRSMVDGATPAQPQWRIASADIREVTP